MRVLLVVYDNGSYISYFPMGVAYIAAALRKSGFIVDVYNQDVSHSGDDVLTKYLDESKYDAVGLSFVAGYYQYRKVVALAAAINRSKNRPFFMLGGHGPTPEPEFFLKKTGADAVVMGEGELTVVELLTAYSNKSPLSDVLGIAYRQGDDVIVNERRSLISDVDRIEMPAYDLFPIQYYRLARMPHAKSSDFVMPMLSGRGCTYHCTFCYRMDKGLRIRSKESIVEEIKYLMRAYGVTYIKFSDELLMSSKQRVVELCEYIMAHKMRFKWSCSGRLNYADPDLLRLMRAAGCVFINYGIEAMDDDVLRKMRKSLTCAQVVSGIEATLSAGISTGYNIIFGNIGDNRKTLMAGVDFLIKYDDGGQLRTIRPVTPYPGSPLYYYAIEKGLLGGVEDFYENKHINSDLITVNFTELSDEEYYQSLYDANMRLLSNYNDRSLSRIKKDLVSLYVDRNAGFRGFRHT